MPSAAFEMVGFRVTLQAGRDSSANSRRAGEASTQLAPPPGSESSLGV